MTENKMVLLQTKGDFTIYDNTGLNDPELAGYPFTLKYKGRLIGEYSDLKGAEWDAVNLPEDVCMRMEAIDLVIESEQSHDA